MNRSFDLSVAKVLARGLGSRPRPSPRIAVIGTCQAFGIAYGFRLLMPKASIDTFVIAPGCLTSIALMTRALKNYDLAFCGDFPEGFLRGGDSQALIASSGARRFPSIVFGGYHPDFIYLQPAGPARQVIGPMGPYHSAITAFGFLSGLTQQQTLALFTADVFERLEYFKLWDAYSENLLSWGRDMGLDLAPALLRWTRRGCFMHTINHPRAHVLFDIARLLLKSVGERGADVDFDDFAVDPLASDCVLPVYEPIADYLGIGGSYLFRTSKPSGRTNCVLNLDEFVARSYDAYSRVERSAIASQRLSNVMGDPQLKDYLIAASGRGGPREGASLVTPL